MQVNADCLLCYLSNNSLRPLLSLFVIVINKWASRKLLQIHARRTSYSLVLSALRFSGKKEPQMMAHPRTSAGNAAAAGPCLAFLEVIDLLH